jgi:hypothetical protein
LYGGGWCPFYVSGKRRCNMLRRRLLVSVMLLASLVVVGCGIPQEDYDAVVADLNKAQQELQSVKAELDKTEADLTDTEADLADTEAELMTAKAELETEQAEVQLYESRLAEAHTYAEVWDVDVDPQRLFLALPTKYEWIGPGKSPDWILNYKLKVSATGDTELSRLVAYAFSLPWGREKDLAWAEVHLRLVENLLATTKP